ncbi:MAG: hypothetical protein SAK29_05460 [Scytonema sp. PMC 1069.18]|nr:hypothetical protein [Scytonema sp. PMC 1069.18]MEC4882213.1 hypothetical protein [Scytonema sp. PMC 1070.18]
MAQVSHSRHTRILPPSLIVLEEKNYRQKQRDTLVKWFRFIFDPLLPQLIAARYNWHSHS